MRLLAMAGLAIAGYLSVMHYGALYAGHETAVSWCGGLKGIDCKSVLNSRWATWFGQPVSAAGAAAYVGLLGLLCLKRCAWSDAVLCALAVSLVGAMGWFVYLQAVELGVWCVWCMAEHAVGVALALLVVVSLRGNARLYAIGSALGAAGVALLIAGQWVGSSYIEVVDAPPEKVVVGVLPVEPTEEDDTPPEPVVIEKPLVLLNGRVILDRAAHPFLGDPDAERVIVEVMDFTCGNCLATAPVLHEVRQHYGPSVSVMVLFFPNDAACNPGLGRTTPEHAGACALAKLALAVWLAEPARFEQYYEGLLLTHEGPVEPAGARKLAEALVGRARLAEALADPRLERMLRRDIALGGELASGQMPWVVVGDVKFTFKPGDAATWITLLETVWPARGAGG